MKKNDKTREQLIHLMKNDPSAAVRYTARKSLAEFPGRDTFIAIGEYRHQFDLPEPTLAYFLNRLYPDGNHYVAYSINLLPIH